jgi:hypothetical protein
MVRRPPAKNHGFECFHSQPVPPQHTPPQPPLQLRCGTGTTCVGTPTRFRLSTEPDAPRQRDYRCLLDLTSMGRRCSALRPWTAFAYHCASLSGAHPGGHHRRSLPVRVSRSATSDAPLASESHRVGVSTGAESRASCSRSVCAARNPRTTTGPFAAPTTLGSATSACTFEPALLPASPQAAEHGVAGTFPFPVYGPSSWIGYQVTNSINLPGPAGATSRRGR